MQEIYSQKSLWMETPAEETHQPRSFDYILDCQTNLQGLIETVCQTESFDAERERLEISVVLLQMLLLIYYSRYVMMQYML